MPPSMSSNGRKAGNLRGHGIFLSTLFFQGNSDTTLHFLSISRLTLLTSYSLLFTLPRKTGALMYYVAFGIWNSQKRAMMIRNTRAVFLGEGHY